MKYILEYNKYSEIYIQTTYKDYRDSFSYIVEFNRNFANSIEDTFKRYQENNIINDDPNSGLFVEYRDKDGHKITDHNYQDGYTCLIVRYKKEILGDDKKYKMNSFVIDIYQTDDEWFFVSFNEDDKYKQNKIYYYKCDQIDGILNFICDVMEKPFDKINI